MKGERVFNLTIGTITIIIVCFYVLLFLGLISVMDVKNVLSSLKESDTIFAIKLSLLTAITVTFVSLLLSLPAAYALSRFNFRFKGLLEMIIDVPIALSPVAFGAMILIFMNSPPGLWIEKNALRFIFEVPGIILAQTLMVVPLCVRILKSHFDTIPRTYELVARSLGCSGGGAFVSVVVPLSKNAILASILTGFAKALGEFGATVTVAGAIPYKTQTLPTSIFLTLASADINKTFVLIFVLILLAIFNIVLIKLIIGKGPVYG